MKKEVERGPNRYRVNIGINYPPNRRAEAGDIVTDIPESAINKLSAAGVIDLVGDGEK